MLVDIFRNRVGALIKLFDHSACFERLIASLTRASPLLLYVICAVTCPQLANLRRDEKKLNLPANSYHGLSLQLLFQIFE